MAYVHNLSPFAIQFSESFGVRWYGLAYLAGFVLGYYAIVLMTRRGGTLFKSEPAIADFITYVAMGVLIGGRLGYCLFYSTDLLTSFDSHFPFWGVLKVNEGGMASHGGILGVMVVCWLYARANKIPILHCMDLVVFGGSLGFFFGRIANFINGELYGRAADPSFAWAVKFPSEILLWVQKEPARLSTLGPAVQALKEIKTADGQVVSVSQSIWDQWLSQFSNDGTIRSRVYETLEALVHATQTGAAEVVAALGPVLTPRHASQLYQCILEGLLVFVVLCWIWRKPQKPGVVGGWFGVLYCVARIIGEQFRMPDAHLGFQWLGLTRGQWLSVGLLGVAIVWLVIVYRRNQPPMGGWNATVGTKLKARSS